MKKYLKELIIILIQIVMFYISPMFANSFATIGMIMLIILTTFILSIIVGIISKSKIKYFYPIVIAILFVPSVFIYYNSSAFIHSIWYLVISCIGLFIGIIIGKIIK